MDLSLQAHRVAPWHLEQHRTCTWHASCSSSQLGLLARKSWIRGGVRCSAASEGEGETSEEKTATTVKGRMTGSWLQGEAGADPYFGWTSNGSQQATSSNATGWIKIGGVAVLAIGFALGARTMYSKKEAVKEFSVPPPVTEETVHTVSKEPKVVEMHSLSGKSDTPTSNHVALVDEANEPNRDHNVPNVHLEEDSTSNQVTPASDDTKEVIGNENNPKSSSLAATIPTSEHEQGSMERQSASDILLLTSENVVEKGSTAGDSSVPTTPDFLSQASDKDSVVTKTINSNDESIDSALDSSLSTVASTEDNNIEEIYKEPDVSTASSEALDATSLPEPILHEPSLHGDKSVEDAPTNVESLEIMPDKISTNGDDDWGERKPNIEPSSDLVKAERQLLHATITAPLGNFSKTSGRLVVPAPVDHVQEQILAALQALKVIEVDAKPADICNRRDYARWLIAASTALTRSPAHKVFPAMFIENSTELAYDDVAPEDPDFPFIQGLAEAGLLSSRLLGDEKQHGEGHDEALNESKSHVFSPDSPLTRQDLVTWKLALERKSANSAELISAAGKEALKRLGGFIDVDKIHEDACPALLADINAGEQSIIALAFGHTRRLQPERPVTNAQAAVALATGEAWELVSEELARLEAESVAEAAVVAELALEMKAQQEAASVFQELLQAEREKQQAAASSLESTRAELERVKAEWENEKYMLMKERASLECQKEFLLNTRREVEEQASALSNAKLEVAFEHEQADKLRAEAEEEKALISKVRSELEIEKNALILARTWAEDEARKALAHSKVLEQVRSRWENQGVQTNIDKELDEVGETVNRFSPSWQFSEGLRVQKSPVDGYVEKCKDVGKMFMDAVIRFFQFILLIFQSLKQQSIDILGKVGGKFHEARIKCADTTTKTVESIKQTVPSSLAGMTSSIREGTSKAIDEWKGGAEKLSQKFKTS